MRNIIGALIIGATLASAQAPPPVEFRHLYTFGSKKRLHPNTVFNLRMVVAIFNQRGQNLKAFGQLGEGVDQMQRADSLYVDPQGLRYLVDPHHGRVLVFSDLPRVLR